MRPFSDLEEATIYPLREVNRDQFLERYVEPVFPIDPDSPIGASDALLAYAAFSDGVLVFIDFRVVGGFV